MGNQCCSDTSTREHETYRVFTPVDNRFTPKHQQQSDLKDSFKYEITVQDADDKKFDAQENDDEEDFLDVDERENKIKSSEQRQFDIDNSLTAIGQSASAIQDDEEGKD